MGDFRNISSRFWSDSKINDGFTPEDKYFYLYLMTNPSTNISGCYEISDKQIVNETGYNIDTIHHLLRRMQDVHKVIRYNPESKEVLIMNWHKYNWPKSEKVRAAILKVLRHVKSEDFISYIIEMINFEFDQKKKEQKENNKNCTCNCNLYSKETDTDTDSDTDTVGYGMDTVLMPYDTPVEEEKTDKPKKHKYGEFNNVLLTEDEHRKLINDGLELMIETLSEAKARMGYKYKSDYLACKAWARRDKEAGRPAMPAAVKNSWMDSYGAGDPT